MYILREPIPVNVSGIKCYVFPATDTLEDMAELCLKLGGDPENISELEAER